MTILKKAKEFIVCEFYLNLKKRAKDIKKQYIETNTNSQ